MSGIFGFLHIDGAPARPEDIHKMARVLERRGPDRTGLWLGDAAALGHTLLATTPEALIENLPLVHQDSGCVISADARLDNRDDLLAALELAKPSPDVGDGELILRAYLAWGETSVARLLGDFAFAIWDPRNNRIFCARDHLGMRQLLYHHRSGRFFAFASEARAILLLERTPYVINEGRIADYLVGDLEGIDKCSTFFDEIYRLPPAHTLSVDNNGLRIQRYWKPEPASNLRLRSNEDYAESFLDVFTQAVRARLRSNAPVGSMLSGGMDSGAVVAVASGLLAQSGFGPLHTFSAVGPDPTKCIETRTIHAALSINGLHAHFVECAALNRLMPDLAELTFNLDEPFDGHMTLVRAVYLAAHQSGIKVVLDGVGGDVVLSEGNYITCLIRDGRWIQAFREAVGQERFWGAAYPARNQLLLSVRDAYAPDWLRRLRRSLTPLKRTSIIDPDFANRVDLADRYQTLRVHRDGAWVPLAQDRLRVIDHPNLTVGRERYDRLAAAVAVEPRDPFLDLRLLNFCLQLPGEQVLAAGWPKVILRRAMVNRLPHCVRWRRGKEHLGWLFTSTLMQKRRDILDHMVADLDQLAPYLQKGALRAALHDASKLEQLCELGFLKMWLKRHSSRECLAAELASVNKANVVSNVEQLDGGREAR